jgi:hypothetical protein
MSGFYLLALIAIWLFVGWVVYRIWRCWKPVNLTRKIGHIVIGVLLFSLWFGGAFWEVTGKKLYWDARVRELCAKDGGVKVYETVVLPAEKFDQYARINWILPDNYQVSSSSEYFYERDVLFYHSTDPQVSRRLTKIIRKRDGKVLGEYIHYGRGGGDLPGPWHGSSYMCPDPRNIKFETSIFSKGGE